MRQRTYELWYALAAMIGLTLVYVPIATQGIPKASGVFGHGIGILGFLLMLSTETLYSLRKRAKGKAIGRMSTWLQIHIFTGLVGPFMVLLHTSWKFNGLAGVLTLMMIIIVLSGIVGRYIYTAVPRTVDGAEVALRDLEQQIALADVKLQELGASRLSPVASSANGLSLVFGRTLAQWRYRREIDRALMSIGAAGQSHAKQLRQLFDDRFRIQQQMQSLATARRFLAVWHTIHIPIGVALFTLSAIHIVETIYYATLIK
ncbi:MAG: hypothetical protein KA765_15360 [Thermoflexales bacterium]|nr:hypothetical protein [Thermoflexales bacterium]